MPEIGTRYVACLPRGERTFCNVLSHGPIQSRVEYYRTVDKKPAHFVEYISNHLIFDMETMSAYVPSKPDGEGA